MSPLNKSDAFLAKVGITIIRNAFRPTIFIFVWLPLLIWAIITSK